MLTIRSEQMAVLDAAAFDRFLQNLETHLRDDFPGECERHSLNEDNLPAVLKIALSTAMHAYGIEYVDDLIFFGECMVLLAPDFYDNERYCWATEILTDEELAGPEKMHEISEYMLFCLEETK